ncbi:MAG: LysM domain-containing protein [Desulfobacterales bacterium]
MKKTFGLYKFVLTLFSFFLILPVCSYAQTDFEVIETETGFYYTVKEGDTLWELSERFNDSPWLWPDVWSQNQQIPNPHLIYPGQKIRLFLRQDLDGLARKISSNSLSEKGSSDDLIYKEPIYYYYSPIESTGFLFKTPPAPAASIFKVKDDKELISTDDMVFIKHLNDHSFSPGKLYVTFEIISPVTHPETDEKIGSHYLLTGVVEITRVEPDFSEAKVVKSYKNISVGNSLMPYTSRSPKIFITESRYGLYGNIVASEKLTRLSGDDTIVFIDKGNKDGVKPGQIYPVFKQDMVEIDRYNKEKVQLTPIVLGAIIVLHTEETTSTVLISQAKQGIPLGAVFGIPIP